MAEAEVLDTSAAPAAPAASTEQPAAGAASPAAEPAAAPTDGVGAEAKNDDAPKSALEAVRRVIDASRAKSAAEVEAGKPKVADAAAADAGAVAAEHAEVAEGEKDWLNAKEYGELPQRVKARLGKLAKERKEFRAQLDANKPDIETLTQIRGYLSANGMSREDFTNGLEFMRLVRHDPKAAWDAIQPVLTALRAHVGEVLPADLQADVTEGRVTPERAKELAASRAENARLATASTARTQADTEAQAQQRARDTHTALTGAVADWEARFKASDPDYSKKAEQVWERMVVLMEGEKQAGRVLDQTRIVAIAEKAKKDVDARISGLLPAPKAKAPVMDGSLAGRVTKQPATALEAARMALTG